MGVGYDSIPMHTRTDVLSKTKAILLQPKIIGSALGTLLIVLLPYLHFGVLYTFWNTNKPPVDRKACTNQCWDTLFKGSYESGERSRYKHIYFNITHQMFKIWALTIVVSICFYEMIKYLTRLVLWQEARVSMLFLLCTDIYPHYYSWWMCFNALNDDFYKQWYHQAFFAFTELASTLTILYLCSRKHDFRPRLALGIITVGLLHIVVSGGDQFVSNVVLGRGAAHQYYRDIGLMVPDLLHIAVPGCELVRWARREGVPAARLLSPADLLGAAVSILVLSGVIRSL